MIKNTVRALSLSMFSICVLVYYCGFSYKAQAQRSTIVDSIPEETFLSGGWATSGADPVSVIAAGIPPNIEHKSFLITSPLIVADSLPVHRSRTERGTAINPVWGASGHIIEGANVEIIRPMGLGSHLIYGSWSSLIQPTLPYGFSTVRWTASGATMPYEILNLARPRLFVVSFARHDLPRCWDAKITVLVDSKEVKDLSGNKVVLLSGSSIMLYGSQLDLVLSKVCSIGSGQSGSSSYSGIVKIAN